MSSAEFELLSSSPLSLKVKVYASASTLPDIASFPLLHFARTLPMEFMRKYPEDLLRQGESNEGRQDPTLYLDLKFLKF